MNPVTETRISLPLAHLLLPGWITRTEAYRVVKDQERYLARTLGSLSKVLEFLKQPGPSIPLRLEVPFFAGLPLLGLGMLVICAVSPSTSLFLAMICLLAPVLAFQKLWRLKAVLALVSASMFMSFILMIPAIIHGSTGFAGFLLLRAMVTSGWMGLGVLILGLPGMVQSMKCLGLPTTLVMVFELSLRGLTVLTEKAAEMVMALQLRSVGKNSRKFLPLAGLAGTLYLESRQFAEEQHQAMMLRGYGLQRQKPFLRRPG